MSAHVLPPWPLFAAFLAASLALAVTPGPGVVYIVARTLAQGRRSGLVSVLGVALGNFGNALAAALGLAALFAVSSLAFSVLKYAGALYLLYLGIRMLRAAPADGAFAARAASPAGKVFRDGFLVALLNPKTTVFYAAFLPQFVTAGGSPMLQTVLLGSIFVAIAACTDAIYVIAAGALAPRLSAAHPFLRRGRFLGGGAFIGLGLLAALTRSDVTR